MGLAAMEIPVLSCWYCAGGYWLLGGLAITAASLALLAVGVGKEAEKREE